MKRTWTRMILGSLAAFALAFQANAAGAIAVNDEEGAADYDYAMVTYARSDAAAGEEALQECRAYGNRSCVIAVRFSQCGAVAVSSKFFRTGTGSTTAEATRKALENCPGCRVAQVACDRSVEAMHYASVSAE